MGSSDLTKKRNANMDLLRMISMMMVTVLHALGKSGLLLPMSGDLNLNGWLAWGLECLSIGAVNIFMLLSGYFLIFSEFKIPRLLEIVFQTFFYTFGTFLFFEATGKLSGEKQGIYELLQYALPIHMDVYWFVTVYVVLYLFLPVLSNGVKNITQKQMKIMILCLVIYGCFFKSFLPFHLAVDKRGYSFLWYLTLFLIGAYFRLYGFAFLKKAWQGWLIFLLGTIWIYAEIYVINWINARTGRLAELLQISLDYNHVFVLAASVGIFEAFLLGKQLPVKLGKVVYALSPMALGVYLFQENPLLRYEWQKWFGLQGALQEGTALFLCRVLGAVLAMYTLGTAIDFARRMLFRFVGKGCGLGFRKSEKGNKEC